MVKSWKYFTKFRNKTKDEGYPLGTFIQQNYGSPRHVREEREMKGIQIGKGVIKLSLFADDMILYIENSKDATRKLLELNNCSTIAGHS